VHKELFAERAVLAAQIMFVHSSYT